MSYFDWNDGPTPEQELAADYDHLREHCDKLEALVETLLDNDPNADAADGVTVIDVWRREARVLLGLDRPKQQPFTFTPFVAVERDDDLPF